jgi:hypothetical protein
VRAPAPPAAAPPNPKVAIIDVKNSGLWIILKEGLGEEEEDEYGGGRRRQRRRWRREHGWASLSHPSSGHHTPHPAAHLEGYSIQTRLKVGTETIFCSSLPAAVVRSCSQSVSVTCDPSQSLE